MGLSPFAAEMVGATAETAADVATTEGMAGATAGAIVATSRSLVSRFLTVVLLPSISLPLAPQAWERCSSALGLASLVSPNKTQQYLARLTAKVGGLFILAAKLSRLHRAFGSDRKN